VRIPFTEILLHWREQAVEQGLTPRAEGLGMRAFAALTERPGLYGIGADLLRRLPLEMGGRALPVLRRWTDQRGMPQPSPKRFARLWKEGIE
jgi:L-lactate dehydrogenase complex protein LldF